jgi:hypothetical protein
VIWRVSTFLVFFGNEDTDCQTDRLRARLREERRGEGNRREERRGEEKGVVERRGEERRGKERRGVCEIHLSLLCSPAQQVLICLSRLLSLLPPRRSG